MITRADYMEGRASHDAYYREIAAECGVAFTHTGDIARFRDALQTDPHMNNIPLGWWDCRAITLERLKGACLREACRARGTFYATLGDGVCVLKAAARAAVEESGR